MKTRFAIVTGGLQYHITFREREIFRILKEKSPQIVTHEELQKRSFAKYSTVKTAVGNLKYAVVQAGGIIEPVRGKGYRLIKVGKFE